MADTVPEWPDPKPSELAQHLVGHHGYTEIVTPGVDAEEMVGWHRSDHRYCWGVKHKNGENQRFIHHTHPSTKES